MYGIKEVGKYNIIFEGVSYDKGIPYEMVIIEKLKDSTRESRKTLFLGRIQEWKENILCLNLKMKKRLKCYTINITTIQKFKFIERLL